MLSDNELRALEELERRYEDEAPRPTRSRPTSRPPGRRALAVLGGISVALLVLGAAVAALALATAGAIGWLFWCLWTHGGDVAARRPGQSVRRDLRWLSEAE